MSEATEAVEPVLDAASEAILEGVDGMADVVEVVRTNPVAMVAVGVVGLAVGGLGGYFFAKKKLKSYYEDLASQEIAEAKDFYLGLSKQDENGDVLSPMEILEQRHPGQNAAAVKALREYRGEVPAETEEDLIAEAKEVQGGPWDEEMDEAHIQKMERSLTVVQETTNVFTDPTFDLEEEKKHRTKTRPYVISHDEYFENDLDYDQIAFTYYEEDDTLVNEEDKIINEVDTYIGDEALVRFGHGSKDNNIVYVRNDKLESDFEVVRSGKSYLVDVLGLPPEEPNTLRHSGDRDRRRAFKHGDG